MQKDTIYRYNKLLSKRNTRYSLLVRYRNHQHCTTCTQSMNHSSMKKSRPTCYVKSPVAQDPFVPIPGLISCTGGLGNNLDQLHINVLIILDVTTFTFFTSTQILWTMFLSNLRGHLGLQRRMKPSVSMLPSWMMMHLKIQRASW